MRLWRGEPHAEESPAWRPLDGDWTLRAQIYYQIYAQAVCLGLGCLSSSGFQGLCLFVFIWGSGSNLKTEKPPARALDYRVVRRPGRKVSSDT